MKAVKILLGGLIGLLIVVALIGYMALPGKVHVARSIVIDAPVANVYLLLTDFRRMNEWSPWHERDPKTKYKYSGPALGKGAKMSWQSEHPDVGSGSQEIIQVQPNKRIETALDFGAQGTAVAFFDLEAESGGTKVTWGFDTEFGMNIIGRFFGLMMDKWVGGDFENGLAKMKTLMEGLPQDDIADLDWEEITVPSQDIAFIPVECAPTGEAIAQALGAAYGRIMAFMKTHEVTSAGQPLSIVNGMDNERYRFDAAIPLDPFPAGDMPPEGDVKLGKTYAGKVLKVTHKGPYQQLTGTHAKVQAFLALRNWKAADRMWEQYVSDPGNTPEDELITQIFIPLP